MRGQGWVEAHCAVGAAPERLQDASEKSAPDTLKATAPYLAEHHMLAVQPRGLRHAWR